MDDHELAVEAVRMAVIAAGPATADLAKWRSRVTALTPEAASMLRQPQHGRENDAVNPLVVARKVLDDETFVFRAEYVGHELEEESSRIIVRFRSDTASKSDTEGDGTEHLRTEPMWTPIGRHMRRVLESLAPGQRCTVYKRVEAFGQAKKSRVLVHLEPGSKPRQTPPGDPTPSPGSGEARPAGGANPPSPPRPPVEHHSPADNKRIAELEERYEALSSPQRVAFARLCRSDGVTGFMTPDTDRQFEIVFKHLDDIEKGPRHG